MKANELVERFIRYTFVEFGEEYAIQCAIIAVDEIYKALETVTGHLTLDTTEVQKDFRYWQEVKQHLEEML